MTGAAPPAAGPFAVYVHVPWCRRVCPYCDFAVRPARTPPEADDLAALRVEIRHWAAHPAWRGRPARSLYFGGGTPSLYTPATVAGIVTAVRDAFGLEGDAEVTLEANPGTVDRTTLAGFRAAGVNRLSLGAQSLQSEVLRTLVRDHTPEDVVAAVAAARAAGFANLSLDLLFAVPGQSLASLEADLERILALEPDHVSAYALTYEEGTAFHRWRARGRLRPVDEDTEATMADRIADRLAAAGLLQYEIASWARPGFESRHNTAYWDGSDYLGFGPAAHSFCAMPLPGRRWANLRDPRAWRAAVAGGGSGVGTEEPLSLETARADFVWTGLRRVRDGVDTRAFRARFGLTVEDAVPRVAALVQDGLLERHEERLRLTARGRRLADAVAAALLADRPLRAPSETEPTAPGRGHVA